MENFKLRCVAALLIDSSSSPCREEMMTQTDLRVGLFETIEVLVVALAVRTGARPDHGQCSLFAGAGGSNARRPPT